MKRLVSVCVLTGLMATGLPGLAQNTTQEPFEKPANLVASSILPKALLSSPFHRVEEVVENDGYLNIYTVSSRFGNYRVVSTALLATRVDEFAAMAAMDKVSGAKEFGKGVWEGGAGVVEGVKNLVTAPGDTLESAASGVGKLFTRAGESMTGSKSSKHEDSSGAKLSGFAATRRETAVAFRVDPYSTNEPLQEKLHSLASAAYAGSLTAMGLKALIPGGVGIAVTSVSGVSWLGQIDLAQPPQDLRIKNRKLLGSMGITRDVSLAFMDNDEFTPTQQSRLVKALSDMGSPGGRSTFLRLAAGTENQDQALFRQRTALMYLGYSRKVGPIRGFVKLGGLVGAMAGDKLVLCFPLDHLCWTAAVGKLTAGMGAAVANLRPAGVELWVTGTVSPTAKKALAAKKWVVREGAGKELLGEKI